MTKMKNTKKGMAKKALSISLIAAMLATSNVPVWAAFEAEDPADVAVEAQVFDAEAPAVDEVAPIADTSIIEEEGVEAYTLTESSDIQASIKLVKDTVEWGTGITVKDDSTLINKVTGEALAKWNYGWREAGSTAAFKTGTVDTGNGGKITAMSLDVNEVTSDLAGKTLELYIYYVDSDNEFNIQPLTITTAKVNPKAITADNTTITFGSDNAANLVYNGFDQNGADQVTKIEIDSTAVYEKNLANAKVRIGGSSAKNAGDEFTVTVTADDPAYTGTVEQTFTMAKREWNADDVVAVLNSGLKYEYTGGKVELNTSDVTLKETTSEDSGADGKLSGADLSSAIKKVVIKDDNAITAVNDAGYDAVVTLDKSKLSNFDFSKTSGDITVNTDGNVKVDVVARDLSKVDVTIGTNNEVEVGTNVEDMGIAFSSNGKTLTLRAGDYTVTVKNSKGEVVDDFVNEGKYTAEIVHKGDNTKNSKTVSFRAEGNVLESAEGSKFVDYEAAYTGKEIKPSKEDIGDLTVDGSKGEVELDADEWSITGYGNNKDVSVDENGDVVAKAYVTVKVLAGTYKDKTVNILFTVMPLNVEKSYITVPKSVVYDSSVKKAADYKLDITVVAKDDNGKGAITLTANDYKVDYDFVTVTGNADGNVVGNKISTKVTVTNKNFQATADSKTGIDVESDKQTKIVSPALQSSSVKVNPDTYVYTGGAIEPQFVVMDGDLELEKDVDYKVLSISNAVNVGTGTIKVEGMNNYSGQASANFSITPADVEDVKVTVDDMKYTGKKVRPTKNDMTITLNGNDVSSQFEISEYGENIKAGTGSVTLKLIKNNKNFSGSTKTVSFNIYQEKVKGELKLYNSFGEDVTTAYTPGKDGKATSVFKYDGDEKTFASVKITGLTNEDGGTTKATADDFEIKYVDNVYGKSQGAGEPNIAYVYAVAKDGVNYSGCAEDIVAADGTIIKNVVASARFFIESPTIGESNVTVKNGVYASGLPVKPQVIVQFGGGTLVEDKDYTIEVDTHTEVTAGKVYDLTIKGKGGYAGIDDIPLSKSWGIDKFNYKDADITVANGQVTVKNGNVIVPSSDYDVKDNGNGTYTISAKTGSKNYTGSKTVEAQVSAVPEITASSDPVVDRNMINVSVTKPVEDASAYDYVLVESEADLAALNFYKYNMSVDGTASQFQFVRAGSYKVYARAIIRDADGKKAYSDWSEAADVTISTDTPNATTINSVTVNGNKVTVTFTPGARTEGVDVMLGQTLRSSNGEPQRPVTSNFTKYLQKNLNATAGRRQTVTFTNVAKGTHYIGVHPYINSSDQYKYFGRWSKQTGATKVVIK